MDDRIGVLAVGCGEPPTRSSWEVTPVGHALVLALDRSRTAWDMAFSAGGGAPPGIWRRHCSFLNPLRSGALCGGHRLFGADRSSVWLHDRASV
jgi:hypothetical protein